VFEFSEDLLDGNSDFQSVQFEIGAKFWSAQFGGVERHRRKIQQIQHPVSDEVLVETFWLLRSLSSKIIGDAANCLCRDRRQRTARIADR
jgi:hypothetical protein